MFTFVKVYHIARSLETDAEKKTFLSYADAIFSARLKPNGMRWECFIQECPRDVWKINGLTPPTQGSAREKLWRERNEPVEVDGLNDDLL
ncbi:putative oxalocrotonate tautomerase [Aspergillus alliaceus]|uniref:Putative oxalocrotonate tautomerase n=1 Tax=Petromyces alliaceus TaxID=209559 RepID=A0A5N7CI02_PETAA|nr:putative oxalocrotonate tautomerase [Aspergillus alliaceus]